MLRYTLNAKPLAEITKRGEVLAALKATENRDAQLAGIAPVSYPVRALDLVGGPSPRPALKVA